jgi:hypothetical protein
VRTLIEDSGAGAPGWNRPAPGSELPVACGQLLCVIAVNVGTRIGRDAAVRARTGKGISSLNSSLAKSNNGEAAN